MQHHHRFVWRTTSEDPEPTFRLWRAFRLFQHLNTGLIGTTDIVVNMRLLQQFNQYRQFQTDIDDPTGHFVTQQINTESFGHSFESVQWQTIEVFRYD